MQGVRCKVQGEKPSFIFPILKNGSDVMQDNYIGLPCPILITLI